MTTQRPYRHALSTAQAFEEIRQGRGAQFCPEVVDAFLRVAARQPAEVMPPGAAAVPLVAVS